MIAAAGVIVWVNWPPAGGGSAWNVLESHADEYRNWGNGIIWLPVIGLACAVGASRWCSALGSALGIGRR